MPTKPLEGPWTRDKRWTKTRRTWWAAFKPLMKTDEDAAYAAGAAALRSELGMRVTLSKEPRGFDPKPGHDGWYALAQTLGGLIFEAHADDKRTAIETVLLQVKAKDIEG